MKKTSFLLSIGLLLISSANTNAMDTEKLFEILKTSQSGMPGIVIISQETKKINPLKKKLSTALKDNPTSLLKMDLPDNGNLSKKDQADLICEALKKAEKNQTVELSINVLKRMVTSWGFEVNKCNSKGSLPIQMAAYYHASKNSIPISLVATLLALKANPFAGQKSPFQNMYNSAKMTLQMHSDTTIPMFHELINTSDFKKFGEERLSRTRAVLDLFAKTNPQKATEFLKKEKDQLTEKVTLTQKQLSLTESLIPSAEK